MAPFAGFTDFSDCTSKMKSKGHDDISAKKICGALQSQTKGASELDVLFSAVDKKDCISKAKEFGHNQESAERICEVISSPDEDIRDDMTPDSKDADAMEERQDDLDNPDNPENNWFKSGEEYADMEQSQVDRLDIALDIIEKVRDEEEDEADEGDDDAEEKEGKTFYQNKNIKSKTNLSTDPQRDTNSYDDLGSGGPQFDHLGADESAIEDGPDDYDIDDLPSLDDNDHIDDQDGGLDDMGDELDDVHDDSGIDSEDIVSKIESLLGGQVTTTNDVSDISVSNTPNLKSKKKKQSTLNMQNQFTDPGKLEKYLDTEAIDWKSDEEADYNEKSDTKKIDLSYYDDDINKCVDEQKMNGLSEQDARNFCNNLANYNGDEGATDKDELLPVKYENRDYIEGSDTGSHVASVVDNALKLLDAYFTREKESLVDPLAGGDGDIPQESDVEDNHPENSIGNGDGDGAHTHNMGNSGPAYDHFGNKVYNEANLTMPDEFTTQSNSTLEGNDHITEHMHKSQKDMADQNLERIPAEDDNASMRGLSQQPSTGNIVAKDPNKALNNGIPEMTAKPEDTMAGPIGAVISDFKQSIAKEYQAAMDRLNTLSSTKQASSKEEEQVIKWTKSGRQTYSAQACEQDFGGDDDAKTVCYHIAKAYDGNYDAYMADMQIKPFESNNKLFVKAFLMDSSVNLNKWGASPITLDQNIRSYVGKPIVLKDDFDHPISNDDNLQHQLEFQELYRIGTIVDVVKKDTRYDAIAEITDPHAQKAFKEGNLPLYVSPQLYKLDSSEPDDSMTKWTGTHLAIVKDPAYTIKRATINGECTGESDKCMTYLKRAAVIRDNGYGNCGYCNYKVLMSSKN